MRLYTFRYQQYGYNKTDRVRAHDDAAANVEFFRLHPDAQNARIVSSVCSVVQ